MLKRTTVIIMASVGICTGVLFFFLCGSGVFLLGQIVWQDRVFADAAGRYGITLSSGSMEIVYDNSVIWESPHNVKVQDALNCDVDGDGQDELVLLVWKRGRYGGHRPFWVEKDERKWSQHIFVYEYDGAKIREKWMSSYIGQDVAKMRAEDDAAQPGRYEPGGEEGCGMPDGGGIYGRQSAGVHTRAALLLTDPKGKVSRWRWDSWGFAKEDTEVTFVVFGDNLIHEPIYQYGLHNDSGFSFLYENMEKTIAGSDVAVINQETPLTDNPAAYGGYPRFGTPVQVGEAIAEAGFDVVTCATNHALDQGTAGVMFTKEFMEEKGIMCLGVQSGNGDGYRPYEVAVRNRARFALFNYTYSAGALLPEQYRTVNLLDDGERIRADIARAREECDFVIVFVHWGTEYANEPDAFQEKWTQIFLESGVDVVVGTHPHTIQPWEMLTGEDGHKMLVYYSIGNYISAQPKKSCVKGGMAKFTVSLTPDGWCITEYALVPLAVRWREGGKYEVEFTFCVTSAMPE